MKKSLPSREYFFKFYGRRFLRIFPLYYFYLLIAALSVIWLISVPYHPRYMQIFLNQAWYAVAYVYDFFFGTIKFQHSNFLDHFWSLSVEEQFYIFWPLLLLLTPEKYLKKLFLVVILLAPIFRLTFLFTYRSGVFRFLADTPSLAVYPLPFTHMDAFALGAYISRYPIPKAKTQFFLLAVLIPVVGFASQVVATGSIGAISALGYPLLLSDAYKFIWAYSSLNYFFAVIVYGVAEEGWFTRFLEWRPLRYLGKISFGMYVYHFPIVWFAGRLTDLGVSEPILKPLVALVAFCGTLLIASLSFRFLERPITNMKDRWFPLKPSSEPEKAVSLAVE